MNSLSIIIPCYNGWQYMSRCLASLEQQTELPDEIIIGDDCSTDDSYEKLQEYANNSILNIKLFKNNENCGPGITRKNALQYVTSEYVAFCDCDDWYELDFVEEVKLKISPTNSSLIIFDNYKTDDNNKIRSNVTEQLVNATKEEILALYPMSLCRFIVEKKVLEKVYFPKLYNGEDGAVVPQIIAKADNIQIIDKPFYNYYNRIGSASTTPSHKVVKGFLEAFDVVYEKLNEEFPTECEFLGIKMICYGATLNAFKAKIGTKAIKAFMSEFSAKYPRWSKNPYLKTYNRVKRFYIKLLSAKLYLPCRVMAKLHTKIVRNRV